ncbi:hypothetical protein ACF068_31190 [Streptomyces sp. NPDC016309]|uniref:hypothetical protein n=1 Tax=Streptomyces sp. NPDC016309 TaxID=3364965 RepID=UPI0036FCF038
MLLMPADDEIDQMHGDELRQEFTRAMATVAAAVSEPVETVSLKLVQRLGLRRRWDEPDQREALREMRTWLSTPKLYRARPATVGRLPRPDGPGQMPYPTRARYAAGATACALCGDAIAPGDIIGRIRDKERIGMRRSRWPLGAFAGPQTPAPRGTDRRGQEVRG